MHRDPDWADAGQRNQATSLITPVELVTATKGELAKLLHDLVGDPIEFLMLLAVGLIEQILL